MPEISVIVPVYKVEKYLNRCVESIVEQTFKDFELILVDDGSPDNSPQLCDMWQRRDKRVRVIHKKNGGASSARNAGLKVAIGSWIFFVDSDDWLERGALEKLYNIALQYDVPMVIGGARIIKKGAISCKKVPIKIKELSQKDLLDRFFRVNGEDDTHFIWGTIIRGDILNDYCFIEGTMNEDVETCYYLARTCTSAVCKNEPLYNYFVNDKGVTNSPFSKKKLDLLKIWDIVQKQVEQYTPNYIHICKMNCKRARFTLLTQMNLNGYDHHDLFMIETKKKLKREVRGAFWELMRWKMPVSRKAILVLDSILP